MLSAVLSWVLPSAFSVWGVFYYLCVGAVGRFAYKQWGTPREDFAGKHVVLFGGSEFSVLSPPLSLPLSLPLCHARGEDLRRDAGDAP